MKLVLITGSTSSMPVISWLLQNNVLSGVVLQDVLHQHGSGFQQWLQQQGVRNFIADRAAMNSGFFDWLNDVKPDIVIVFGFSFIFPPKFFDTVSLGFYNIHFSLLPAYKGPLPLFWQLRNGEKMSGISIHRMTEKPDNGEVLVQMPYHITENDTFGLLHARLSEQVIPALAQLLQMNLNEALNRSSSNPYQIVSSYQKRPEAADLQINWQTMSGNQIKALVQACNPLYQGAGTFFMGMEMKLLQVTVMNEGITKEFLKEQPNGSILSDSNDLIVNCFCGEPMRIDIVATSIGVMTGDIWKNIFIDNLTSELPFCFS